MDNRLKRFLSLALAMIMVIGMMPANVVFATENGGDTPDSNDPAVVAETTEPEVTEHQCVFEEIAKVEATWSTPGSRTLKCECGQEKTEKICATGCWVPGSHDVCEIMCSMDSNCVLDDGHDGLCVAFDGMLLLSNIENEEQLVLAMNAGGEIKLANDLVLETAVTVPAGVNAILDMNGKSITMAEGKTDAYALINMGTLTVKGSGFVAGIRNGENGTNSAVLTVENGTFDAKTADAYAILNYGTATIEDGIFNAAGGYALRNYSSATMMIEKATSIQGVYNAGKLTITTGSFVSSASTKHAVWSHAGLLTINGGEFDNNIDSTATIKVSDQGAAVIAGGAFDTDADAAVLELADRANVTINDGNINDSIIVAEGATLTVNGGSFQDPDGANNAIAGSVVVKGGTFTDANTQAFATAHAAADKIILFKNGTNSVEMVKSGENALSQVVAKIGSGDAVVGYPSLETAVAAATDGTTINVVADLTIGEAIAITNKSVTIKGSEAVNLTNTEEDAFQVSGSATLTLGANLNITSNNALLYAYGGGDIIIDGAKITVSDSPACAAFATGNGSTITIQSGSLSQSGTDKITISAKDHATVNVSGGTVESANSSAIAAQTNATVYISDGVVKTTCEDPTFCAVFARSGGKINVSGGEISAAAGVGAVACADGKVNISGDAKISKGGVKAHENAQASATITGGTINGAVSAADGASMVISGGTFDAEPAAAYVDARYEAVQVENSTNYNVQLKKVDTEKPEDTNKFVQYNGAEVTTVTANQILDAIYGNENLEDITNNTGYTLIITPKSIVIEAGETDGADYKTSKITYSVTPVTLNGDPVSNPGGTITFNLPIPGTLPAYITHADVYHNDDYMGKFEVKGDKVSGKGYVTIESANFSDFTIELIDIDERNDVAKIGVKGYESVQAAVNAVKDGETIELMDLPENRSYGDAAIALDVSKKFTIDGKNKFWADATITITGGASANQADPVVTIKNVAFTSQNKTSGEFIKITGDGSKYNNVLIQDCTFAGPGSSSGMVAISLNNTNGVVINDGSGSGLKAYLENVAGKNLTISGVGVTNSDVGMDLGTVQGVTLNNVTITATTGKYGVSLDGSVNNNAVFNGCTITAHLPIMVHSTTANGKIKFEGANSMTGTVTGNHWLVLADAKYTAQEAGTNPKTLSTSGRWVITLNGTGLDGEGINYKYNNGSKYYTVAPEGVLNSSVVFDDAAIKNDSNISCDITGVVASETIEIWIYDADGKVLSVTSLAKPEYLYDDYFTVSVEIARNSSTWNTDWDHVPVYFNVPAKAALVIDGKEMTVVDVEMYRSDFPNEARVWTDVEGVGNMTLTVGETVTWKHTLAEALVAAPINGGTVTLFKDNDIVLSAAGEVTGGKTVTITGEATFDWNQNWLYIGRSEDANGTDDGTLIFDNAKIKAAGEGDAIGFNVSGAKANESNTCNGTLKITNGSNIETDFIINRNKVEVDGASTLTVRNGFHVHGRKDAPTATMDVKGGSSLVITDAYTATLGDDNNGEGNGILNVTGSSFTCKGKFNIASGSELNVSGESTLNINEAVGKAINIENGATVKNSSVGGKAVVTGKENEKIAVTFENTVKFDGIEASYADVNVEGVNNFGNLSVLYGELHTNTESKINVNKLYVGEAGAPIIIDAAELADETAVRVINQAKDTAGFIGNMVLVAENADYYVVYGEDADYGDVAVSKVDRSIIYFDSTYEGELGDEVAEGRYLGINAFAKFKNNADGKLALPEETTTIVLAAGNAETASYGQLLSNQDLVVKTEGNGYAAIDRILNTKGDLTVAEASKIKVLGENGNSGADNLGGVFTINGEVLVASGSFKLWRNGDTQIGKLVIGATGDLVLENGNVVNEGEITINVGGLITAKNIAGTDNYTGTITVNADALATVEKVKVIELTNGDAAKINAMVSVNENADGELVAAKWVDADNGSDVYVYFEAFVDKDNDGNLDADEKGYATLAAALEVAEDNQSVVLLAKATASELVIDNKITLDLKGNTVSGDNILGIDADGVTVKNGKLDATEIGIAVGEDASLTLTNVTVESDTVGVASFGKVTLGEGAEVKGIDADADPDTGSYGMVLCNTAEAAVAGGKVSGDVAVMVFGGKLNVTSGTVDGGKNYAIVTYCYDDISVEGDVSVVANAEVNISGGNVSGEICVMETDAEDMPEGYISTVTITGGTFTSYRLYAVGEINKIVVSGGTFDKFVPLDKCATDYTCQQVKDSDPVMYEVVPAPGCRIYMNDVDDVDMVIVGEDAYVDGDPYEVLPGKVILLDKEQAKKKEMFITTYSYEDKDTEDKQDDYPSAMYVWYAKGTDSNNDGVCDSYAVERVTALDNFFVYHGTSIRVGGSDNGIRFFSSVDATDANKLMNGSLITDADSALYDAKMTLAGTEFWKRVDNKLRSEVYGGAAGSNFRVFQQYQGRNWFTGVLVGLDTSAETVVASIYSRPYAEIVIGDKTATLYGGILDRSIYNVAKQNQDVFTEGSSYDKFVENLITMGDEYLNSSTGTEGDTGTGSEGDADSNS